MTEKKNYAVIANLEKQLMEHSANFEQWKLNNSKQTGTPSYMDYVAKFAEWEREIRARIAALQGSSLEEGPKNVDSIINELLDDVGIYEFMFSLANMHMTDKTFISSFVQEFQKFQRTPAEPSLVVPTAQFYPPAGFAGYNNSSSTNNTMASWNRTPVITPMMQVKRSSSPAREFQKRTPGAPFRDFSV